MSSVHVLKSTGSTNKVAYELALQGEPEGTSVMAHSQSEGRGRLGKVWTSPPEKGLYCSIIVRPVLPLADYPKITLAAGLAVALVLEELTSQKMQLKWPNDVYAAGKKCCGILTEASPLNEEATDRFAIVGVGININTELDEFPADLQDKATSLRMLTGTSFDIQAVFNRVRSGLLAILQTFQEDGFSPILREWRKRDMLYGRLLQWVSTSGEIILGLSEGPDEDGRLMVKAEDGKLHQILSGDINLATSLSGEGGG